MGRGCAWDAGSPPAPPPPTLPVAGLASDHVEVPGAGEPDDGGWGPWGVEGGTAPFPRLTRPLPVLWPEMGNTLGLAPMGALPRRSPRREDPLPNPGSFDELHRLCKGESLASGRLTWRGQSLECCCAGMGAERGERAGAASLGRVRCPSGVERLVAGLQRRSVPPARSLQG